MGAEKSFQQVQDEINQISLSDVAGIPSSTEEDDDG